MPTEKKTLKFQMMMSESEAAQLDDWMFANRVRSRAEAIRRLWKMGFVADDARAQLAKTIRKIAIMSYTLRQKHNKDAKLLPIMLGVKEYFDELNRNDEEYRTNELNAEKYNLVLEVGKLLDELGASLEDDNGDDLQSTISIDGKTINSNNVGIILELVEK